MSNKRRKGGEPTRPQKRSLNRKSKRIPMSGHEAKVMGEVITKPVTIFLRRWITTTLEEAGKTDAIAEVDELVRRHRGWVTATAVLPALEAGRTSTPSIIPEGHIAISVVDLTQRGADGQQGSVVKPGANRPDPP